MNLLPVGLYEYGALTISGPLFYSKLEKYEIAKTWNEELRIIKFYPKQRHTRSIYQLYLLTEDIPAAKKFFRTFSQVVSQKSTNEDTREPL